MMWLWQEGRKMPDPDGQDFFSMKLLVQDLTKIQADICTAIQNGTQWSTINFSCTRDELDKWRVTASSILYDLAHIKKGQETQKAAISEAYNVCSSSEVSENKE